MIRRHAETILRELVRSYPVVAITGPRQSGKTTLTRVAFPEKPYVSLEELDQREFAEEDPRGFLARYPEGAILDEVQRCPGLFSYLQGVLDHAGRPGMFLLTGSQQFGLLAGITQTLAGRVALLHLLPFTLTELESGGWAARDLDTVLFMGCYPPVYDRRPSPSGWYANYVQTYVERDVRQMVNVRDLSPFRRFVRLCAARIGQLLNLSGLANDCGITHNTAKAWLSVLEASYIVFLLSPHHRNFNKRLVKTPKLYFYDTGLAAWLLGIREPSQLAIHALRGALFESWVISELLKSRFNRALDANLYFWRDRSGHEVDVLVEQSETLLPLEVKSGRTVTRDSIAGLQHWLALAGDAAGKSRLVYAGETSHTRSGIEIRSWRDLSSLSI